MRSNFDLNTFPGRKLLIVYGKIRNSVPIDFIQGQSADKVLQFFWNKNMKNREKNEI